MKNNWKKVKIEDLVGTTGLLNDGDWVESKDQDPEGDIRLVQLADIGDGTFKDKSERFMNESKFHKLNCTEIQKGDILIARMPDPLGRACIFPGLKQKAATVVDVAILRVDESIADNSFVMYMINTPSFRNLVNNHATGTTRKRISRKNLSSLEIPLPPLDVQKKIADALDKADEIRRNKQEAIDKLDELVQSVFLDMFGDPVRNEKKWEKVNLESLTSLITDGKHGNCNDLPNSGYYFISAKDIYSDKINYDNPREIPKDEFQEVDRRTNLQAGDLVMVNTGATIGKMAIAQNIPETRRTTFQKSVAVIKCKEEVLDSYFLMNLFKLRLNSFAKRGAGSAVKNLLLSEMRRFEIIKPEIALQREFVIRAKRIEASLEKNTKQGDSLDNLFNSLMQKAFKGELEFN